jgi:hypothetical protein
MRPNAPRDPAIEPVEELSDVTLGVPEFRRCGLMDTQSCLKSCAASGCANLAFALT